MTARLLLASLFILALAASIRAQPRTGASYSAMAADVGGHRLKCPPLSQLPFCYRPIQNLLRQGQPLSEFCCGIINEISDPCDHLFRYRHWFIVSRQTCSASTPPTALPAHGGLQHVAPQPIAAPVVSAPTPSPPLGLEHSLAPTPAAMEEEPSPAPVPSQSHLPKRMLVTSELGAYCHDAINRFHACRNNYAGSHNFDDAIRTPCCDAVKDVISVCSPEDWPSVPYFLSSSDRCINPVQQ